MITESDMPLHNDPCDPKAPMPPEPNSDPRSVALIALDSLLQSGIERPEDQVQVASALAGLACARLINSQGYVMRSTRRKFIKWATEHFEKRLKTAIEQSRTGRLQTINPDGKSPVQPVDEYVESRLSSPS